MFHQVVFIGLVLLVAALAFWYARRLDQKRTDAWRAFARQRGWTFTNKDRNDRPGRFHAFEPFGQGDDRYARWIVEGKHDSVPFELFSYHYEITSGSGKSRNTHHYWFGVCVLEMPIASPGLSVRDEHLGHKLFDMLGGEDIDFESDEFSRRFWVKGEDHRFVYDVIHPAMIEFLLTTKDQTWQWRGRDLLLVTKGRLHRADCDRMLRMASTFRSHLPRHLLTAAP